MITKSLLFSGVAVVASAALISPVYAADQVLDKTSGTWSNTIGGLGVNYQTVGSENQVRWGTSTGSGQSGLGFTGIDYVPNLTIIPFNQFEIGTLRHFNNPISSGSAATGATLSVIMDFFGAAPVDIGFDFDSIIDETLNATPCAYLSTPGNPCADKITIKPFDPFKFYTFEGENYTLNLSFQDEDGNFVDSLISQEQGTTSAKLYGSITPPPPPAPPVSEVPGPLPVLGIFSAFAYSRKLRNRIKSSI